MDVIEFLKTIYLGDRGCKSLLIDGFHSKVKMQVTCISRVEGASWNYNTTGDINDGFIVFNDVTNISFQPAGFIPNNFINDITAEKLTDNKSKYLVTINVGSVDEHGNSTEVIIKIFSDSISLENSEQHPVG